MPAPFGPNRPTIWPARQSTETRARARAAAEVARDTSHADDVEIDAGIEGRGPGHRSGAAVRRRHGAGACRSRRGRPEAGEHDHAGGRERDVARPRAWYGRPVMSSVKRLPGAHRGARCDDQQLSLLGHDALRADLWRPQIEVAGLEREHDELLQRRRPLLLEPRDRSAVRQLEPDGDSCRPGREWPSDHDAWSVGGRLRRRVLHRRRADRAPRQLERQRSADVDRRRARS